MAKGRRSSNRSLRDSASPVDDARNPAIPKPSRTVRDYLPENFYREVQDNRTWQPDRVGRAKTVSGSNARIVAKPNVKRGPNGKPLRSADRVNYGRAHSVFGQVTSRLGFSLPHEVLVCIRRHMRREVLFALKKRKAGAGAKRRRRNKWSDIDC